MMKTLEQFFDADDIPSHDVKLCKMYVEKGWNGALQQVEKSLETADNLGDVKDTIQYLKQTDE